MSNAFRTLILEASTIALARELAASFGTGGMGMWTTPLNATGSPVAVFQDAAGTIPVTEPGQPVGLILETPATHYISTGIIPEEFAYMMPTQIWEQDENGQWVMTSSVPGDPASVWGAASQAGVQCTLAEVQAIFDTADVTPQEPFVAMGRLGLKIINPPEAI